MEEINVKQAVYFLRKQISELYEEYLNLTEIVTSGKFIPLDGNRYKKDIEKLKLQMRFLRSKIEKIESQGFCLVDKNNILID